ncbi:hypothetical protein HBB16_07995 [Pseudonocardia sp. MCCB 268]|nr:hypothetical protein [Pseudonocardia cytotoxica]
MGTGRRIPAHRPLRAASADRSSHAGRCRVLAREDTVLRRPVGASRCSAGFLPTNRSTTEGTARAEEAIVRALRSGCFEHAGSARLLDVLSPGSHGPAW